MKYQVIALVFSIFASRLVLATDAADAARNSNTASSEVAPLLAQMGAAANAHDVERHVGVSTLTTARSSSSSMVNRLSGGKRYARNNARFEKTALQTLSIPCRGSRLFWSLLPVSRNIKQTPTSAPSRRGAVGGVPSWSSWGSSALRCCTAMVRSLRRSRY